MLLRPASGRLRSAALSAALLLASTALHAAEAGPTTARAPAADVLKPLPASHDELVFRGENSRASFPVFMSRIEAARAGTFQLGLLNTVSLLPERSSLRVAVNGRMLANTQIRSAEKASLIPVRIPPGVLVPGFNDVQVSVAMTHRVDCSIKATYELWTALDPAQTGFLVPAQAALAARTLDDLAAESPATDGTSRIHLRAALDADAETLSRGATLIAALVARSHLSRPVVDIGPEPGSGPGFDVVLDQDASSPDIDARVLGRQDGVVFTRTATNRLVLTPEGSDLQALASDLKASTAKAAVPGTAQGLRSFARTSGTVVGDESRLSFADLGVPTQTTAGRRFVDDVGVTLPEDFYAGNYGKAQIYLDGSRAASLVAGAALVFRVNGTLVSTLPLGPGSPERFEHTLVELPLQFFRPGFNDVQLEALMPTAADEQCDLTAAPSGPRLTVADTSELVVPHFARIATVPQITPSLGFDAAAAAPEADIYLGRADQDSIAQALTVAANMAARDHNPGLVRINLDEPSPADKSGIVIGALPDLPNALAAPLRSLVQVKAAADAASPDGSSVPPDTATVQPVSGSITLRDRFRTAMFVGEQWLRHRGFFFAGLQDERQSVALGEHGIVLAAVSMDSAQRTVAGFDLPAFTRTPNSWLVVSGQSAPAMSEGLRSLVAEGRWKDMNGEVAVYDPDSGTLQARAADLLTYVLPSRITLGDLRPILGGVISGNIIVACAGLLLLLTLLGLSTQLLVRVFGERPR